MPQITSTHTLFSLALHRKQMMRRGRNNSTIQRGESEKPYCIRRREEWRNRRDSEVIKKNVKSTSNSWSQTLHVFGIVIRIIALGLPPLLTSPSSLNFSSFFVHWFIWHSWWGSRRTHGSRGYCPFGLTSRVISGPLQLFLRLALSPPSLNRNLLNSLVVLSCGLFIFSALPFMKNSLKDSESRSSAQPSTFSRATFDNTISTLPLPEYSFHSLLTLNAKLNLTFKQAMKRGLLRFSLFSLFSLLSPLLFSLCSLFSVQEIRFSVSRYLIFEHK